MAQFDAYRLRSGDALVIDCQSNLLEFLDTRFVAPLMPIDRAPKPAQRLNPVFELGGAEFVMVTQFASTVQRAELADVVASWQDRSFDIVAALDVLISGV